MGWLWKKIAGSIVGSFVGSNLMWIIPTALACLAGAVWFHLWRDDVKFEELVDLRAANVLYKNSQESKQQRIESLTDRLKVANQEKLDRIAKLETENRLMDEAVEEAKKDREVLAEAFAGARIEIEELRENDQDFREWSDAKYPDAGWRFLREAVEGGRTD